MHDFDEYSSIPFKQCKCEISGLRSVISVVVDIIKGDLQVGCLILMYKWFISNLLIIITTVWVIFDYHFVFARLSLKFNSLIFQSCFFQNCSRPTCFLRLTMWTFELCYMSFDYITLYSYYNFAILRLSLDLHLSVTVLRLSPCFMMLDVCYVWLGFFDY